MVTHCRSNFIMLISNLPSVRSSRYKPNVGNRVIRVSLSLLYFFVLQSHSVLLLSNTNTFIVVVVVVFVVVVVLVDYSAGASRICTATKTTATTVNPTIVLFHFFFFSFLYEDASIRFIRSPEGEKRTKRKRVAPFL